MQTRNVTNLDESVRREIGRELFTLGLTQQDVATALDLDSIVVKKDYDGFGGKSAFPDFGVLNDERRNRVYGNALLVYAKMLDGQKLTDNGESAAAAHGVFKALGVYLDVKHIKAVAEGVARILNALINPFDPPEYVPYRTLLHALFGERECIMSGQRVFSEYFDEIAYIATAPNRESLGDAMAAWAIDTYRIGFSLPLGESAVRGIEQALGRLSVNEDRVIRIHFGIGQEAKSFERMVPHFSVTRERIRQIEAKALRKLRNPKVSERLRCLIESPVLIAEKFLESQFPAPPLPPPPVVEPDPQEIFTHSVEELELSVRSYNGITGAGISFIGELVQKSEKELLRQSKFGRKSLNEVKEVLRYMGLCLGMKVENGLFVLPKSEI